MPKVSNADVLPLNFRMCKYCGSRIKESRAYNHRGHVIPGGVYCSIACSESCHGFENKMETEQRLSLSVLIEASCGSVDFAEIMAADKPDEKVSKVIRYWENLAEIDLRLPGIVMFLSKGGTQTAASKRLGISRKIIYKLIGLIRR